MSFFQQRISFKGSEDSIDFFTKLLRDVKIFHGLNSADVLLSAAGHWLARPLSSPIPSCTAQSRRGCSRIFYLQILTSTFIICKLNAELERLQRDPTLRMILEAQHRINRQEFLLEALIIVLEFYKNYATNRFMKPPLPTPSYVSNPESLRSLKILDNECSELLSSESNKFKSPLKTDNNEARYISKYTGSKSSHQITSDMVDFRLNQRCFTPEITSKSSSANLGNSGYKENQPEQHLISWRKRLRDQQLAENRKLTESIRSRSSASRQNSVERNSEPDQEKTFLRSRSLSRPPLPPTSVNHSDHNNNIPVIKTIPTVQNKKSTHLINNSLQPQPSSSSFLQGPRKFKSKLRPKYEILLDQQSEPIMTLKERNKQCEVLSQYLNVQTEENRIVPGFCEPWSKFQRTKEGIDCDEVYPGIILGNGATLRCKDYLKRIGITHILNAAEYTGVNLDESFFKGEFQYLGLRVEDTPQTQICRYFLDVAEYIDEALLNEGKVYVNCVFGKSRSTSCVMAYLLLAQNWSALKALQHIRRRRPVNLNYGFLQQIADLESKLIMSTNGFNIQRLSNKL